MKAKDTSKETKFELRNVDDLIPYARNARTHSPEQVNKLAGSIKEFGFLNPVVISEDGGILAGHGRVLAAQKLGLKQVPCVIENHLSDIQKKAYILADNRLALDAGWDEEMLAFELKEITNNVDFDIDVIGFEIEEIDSIINKYCEQEKDDKQNEENEAKDSEIMIDGDNEKITVEIIFKDFNSYSSFLEDEKQQITRRYGAQVLTHVSE